MQALIIYVSLTLALLAGVISSTAAANSLELPAGLEESPSIPAGLTPEPSLPDGLESAPDKPADSADVGETLSLDYESYGWLEYRVAKRIRNKSNLHSDTALNELRFHTDNSINWEASSLEISLDLLADTEAGSSIDIHRGEGWIDLRKLSYFRQIGDSLDLRAGRQVLTWGTGDLLFLNDLFPKDWHYMLGRDIEYIKTPSDAVKLTWYLDKVSLDLVYTPSFEPDGLITGERMSFFDPRTGALTGTEIPVKVPDKAFKNDEFNLRIANNIEGVELALYAYEGYYHSPSRYDPAADSFTFSRLRNIGASLRSPLAPGIINVEVANWISADDPDGKNPWIKNSETRFLIGYEWEAIKELTLGVQYYSELMQDYKNYKNNLPVGAVLLRQTRDLVTLRVTRFLLSQKLKLGFFTYYQPENGDYYLRPEFNYQVSDRLTVESGMTVFGNREGETFANFGQLEENSQLFVMMRYYFDEVL